MDQNNTRMGSKYLQYSLVQNIKEKGVGYNPKNRLYQVKYEDEDKADFYHNRIHGYRNHQLPCAKFRRK